MSERMDYRKFVLEGHVPEQDHHFTVTFLPIMDGFVCHDVKKRPKLSADQWVEVIHRNGERSRGPVDTFAWGLHPCGPILRQDYHMRDLAHIRASIDERKSNVFEIIGLEITHYRATPTPPEDWVQGDPWPFEDQTVAEGVAA